MGMFWIAAAAAAYKKSHSGRRCHRTNKGEVHYDGIRTSNTTHTYYDCVKSEVNSDKEGILNKFFELLEEAFKKDVNEKITIVEKDFADKKEEYNKALQTYSNIKNIFESEDEYETFRMLVKRSNNIEELINSIDFEIDFYYNKIDKSLDRLKALNREISEYKRRKLITLTNKDFWRIKIEASKDSYDYLAECLERDCEKVSIYDNIKSIYKNNQDLINTAVNEEISTRPLKEDVYSLQNQLKNLNSQKSGDRFNKSRMEQVFEEMIKNGEITETKLQEIYLLLDKVEIKGRRGEYSFSSYGMSYLKSQIILWFIQNVYELDPEFVNRNYDLLEEEEGISLKRTNNN